MILHMMATKSKLQEKFTHSEEKLISTLYVKCEIRNNTHPFLIFYSVVNSIRGDSKAKSRKYQGVFEVKSRVKTMQVRGIWSQQLEHKQVPQWGTEQGVRKGKRSLLACHTCRKCSMETSQFGKSQLL